MELQKKMEYAITLSALDFKHEYEDIFKLVSLCEEIEKLIQEARSRLARVNQAYATLKELIAQPPPEINPPTQNALIALRDECLAFNYAISSFPDRIQCT